MMLKHLLVLPLLGQTLSLTLEIRQDPALADCQPPGCLPPTPVNPIAPSSAPAQGAIGPPTPVNPIAQSSAPAQGAIGPPTPVNPVAQSSAPADGAVGSPTTVEPIVQPSSPPSSSQLDSYSAATSPASSSYAESPPTPSSSTPPTPPSPSEDEQNDGYPYPSVKFTAPWPSEFKTGETVHMEWTGGSGRYDVWWLQSWKNDTGCYTQQYYFLRNESYTSYDFYFSPAGCWKRDASFLFGVQEGDVQAGSVTQRDHATGPLQYLIRGPDDDYNEC